ncbi:hypothetical protein CR513_47081, partial [Mucuna pruriens]
MVISIITVEYKVKRVLIDQESLVNILYWSMFQKLGLPTFILNAQVELRGIVELKTTFGTGASTRSISILYTVVDT